MALGWIGRTAVGMRAGGERWRIGHGVQFRASPSGSALEVAGLRPRRLSGTWFNAYAAATRAQGRSWRNAETMDQKLELLKRCPLLAGLNRHDIEQVGRLADEVDVPAGKVLMKQGDPGREFYVIVDGAVRIERDGKVIRTMGPGEFFGEIALVVERPRTATATVDTDSRLLVLAHREFHSLMDQFPSIRISVLESIALRLRDLEPDRPH
jgi:hypothetical protein